jgi:thioredoxin 1
VTLTDANFREIVSGEQPVLVDFWAPWCGPCRMIAPAIEQLAQEFQGKAVIGKLNVDENPMTAQQFRVMSIPMIMIFKDGQPVEQMVGVQPVQVLRQRLLKHLS